MRRARLSDRANDEWEKSWGKKQHQIRNQIRNYELPWELSTCCCNRSCCVSSLHIRKQRVSWKNHKIISCDESMNLNLNKYFSKLYEKKKFSCSKLGKVYEAALSGGFVVRFRGVRLCWNSDVAVIEFNYVNDVANQIPDMIRSTVQTFQQLHFPVHEPDLNLSVSEDHL